MYCFNLGISKDCLIFRRYRVRDSMGSDEYIVTDTYALEDEMDACAAGKVIGRETYSVSCILGLWHKHELMV